MKRVIAIAIALIAASSSVAFAQASSTVSLAEVARREEARRKTTKKATRVITNANLGAPEDPVSVAPPPSTGKPAIASGNTTPPTISGGKAEPVEAADKKDQAYWQNRISTARLELSRTQMFAESLQTRINSLRTDFVNRDNRVEREKIQVDLNAALAELERLKKEIEKQTKGIAAIEDEARRANVPSGWLRPGA
jgi:type II secretory pathway pseudopilin PulG